MISVTTEAAPEENVVMRNTWITWKAMYQCWVLSSTLPRVTSPLSFAINLHTMGTKAIKMASITDGKRPVTTPKIWLGISLMKLRKGTLSRSSTLSVKSLQSVASHDLFIAPPKRDANFCWFRYSSGTSVKRTVREDIRAALKGARRYV